MKQFTLFALLVLLSFCVKAQTFFYIDSIKTSGGDISNCGNAELTAYGFYSDPCSYHPSLGDSASAVGTNLYLHITTRNLSCDSGLICLAVLVPGTQTFSVPLNGVPANTYNSFLVTHHVCPVAGNSIDTTPAGVMGISNSLPSYSAVVTHVPSSGITLGTSINYTLTTNASTTLIVDWYVNGVLAQSGSAQFLFTHVQASAKDSVYAVMRYKVQNCDAETQSNGILTIVEVPEAISDDFILHTSLSVEHKQINVRNAKPNEHYKIFDMQGNVMWKGTIKQKDFIIDASTFTGGNYLLKSMSTAATFKFCLQ
jgi:hypothetical protein